MVKKNIKPFISICTPTFNRRHFIPIIIKCFEHQTYPKNRMEWIIIDDGTDKIEDLVKDIKEVKYFKYDEKMSLGKKRNIMHEKTKGDIIIYMDDDDYYPPERVSHAVETLQKNPQALCAGSSIMYIYFKHINKLYKFGPYGPNHSTAATFAFRKELLKQTKYDESCFLAEEKAFLKNYTIPFVQLDPLKCILVFSHNHNSFDKKNLLGNKNDPYVKETDKNVDDFVKNKEIKKFFMEDIDTLLNNYEPGEPKNKPDVLKQIEEIKSQREKLIEDQQKIMKEKIVQDMQNQMGQQSIVIQQLINENNDFKNKIKYLEEKITKLINDLITEKKINNKIE